MEGRTLNIMYNGSIYHVQVEDAEIANLLETDAEAAEQFMRNYFSQQPGTSNSCVGQVSQPLNNKENFVSTDVSDSKLWPDECTRSFISLVKDHQKDFETALKKTVWLKITTKLNSQVGKKYNVTQMESKWKSLVRSYKDIKNHNDTSGNQRKSWRFYLLMNEILFSKPEIVSPATCSSAEGIIVHNVNNCENGRLMSSFEKKRKSKQESAERRHKEKMAKIDELNSTMKDLVNVIREKKQD